MILSAGSLACDAGPRPDELAHLGACVLVRRIRVAGVVDDDHVEALGVRLELAKGGGHHGIARAERGRPGAQHGIGVAAVNHREVGGCTPSVEPVSGRRCSALGDAIGPAGLPASRTARGLAGRSSQSIDCRPRQRAAQAPAPGSICRCRRPRPATSHGAAAGSAQRRTRSARAYRPRPDLQPAPGLAALALPHRTTGVPRRRWPSPPGAGRSLTREIAELSERHERTAKKCAAENGVRSKKGPSTAIRWPCPAIFDALHAAPSIGRVDSPISIWLSCLRRRASFFQP